MDSSKREKQVVTLTEVVTPSKAAAVAEAADLDSARKLVNSLLDSSSSVWEKKGAVTQITGRMKARIMQIPEGRDLILAMTFDAAVRGGIGGGQLKALALLLGTMSKNSLLNGFDGKIRATKDAQGIKIEVDARKGGSDFPDGDED